MDRSTVRNAVILGLVALVIAPALMMFAVVNFLATDREQIARQRWESVLGSFDDVMRRHPATEANASALELERLSAAVGITLSPRNLKRHEAGDDAADAFSELRRTLGRYHTEQFGKTRRGTVGEPPESLSLFMDRYADELDALRSHLIESDVPVWESDLSELAGAPIPNLLGQINLQKLLSAVALAQVHAGDREGALETMHAAWRLSRSLKESPLMICQLIHLSATRLQIGTLRHIPDVPEVWLERLAEHDSRQALIHAMRVEGWVWMQEDSLAMPHNIDFWASGNAKSWLAHNALSAVQPYVTLCVADASKRWLEAVDRLERVDVLCDRDLAASGADMNIQLPSWNRIGAMMLPNMGEAVKRVAQSEVDLELLRLAIEADAVRRDSGSWPVADGIARDAASCPGDQWVYRATDGTLEIGLSRSIDWDLRVGVRLPQRLRLD